MMIMMMMIPSSSDHKGGKQDHLLISGCGVPAP